MPTKKKGSQSFFQNYLFHLLCDNLSVRHCIRYCIMIEHKDTQELALALQQRGVGFYSK